MSITRLTDEQHQMVLDDWESARTDRHSLLKKWANGTRYIVLQEEMVELDASAEMCDMKAQPTNIENRTLIFGQFFVDDGAALCQGIDRYVMFGGQRIVYERYETTRSAVVEDALRKQWSMVEEHQEGKLNLLVHYDTLCSKTIDELVNRFEKDGILSFPRPVATLIGAYCCPRHVELPPYQAPKPRFNQFVWSRT